MTKTGVRARAAVSCLATTVSSRSRRHLRCAGACEEPRRRTLLCQGEPTGRLPLVASRRARKMPGSVTAIRREAVLPVEVLS